MIGRALLSSFEELCCKGTSLNPCFNERWSRTQAFEQAYSRFLGLKKLNDGQYRQFKLIHDLALQRYKNSAIYQIDSGVFLFCHNFYFKSQCLHPCFIVSDLAHKKDEPEIRIYWPLFSIVIITLPWYKDTQNLFTHPIKMEVFYTSSYLVLSIYLKTAIFAVKSIK